MKTKFSTWLLTALNLGAALLLLFRDSATAQPVPIYQELYRPQFHYSSPSNWLNDPNGLVYQNETYHLFHQYNPSNTVWGNMSWGHAISTNLVQWQWVGVALYPDTFGTIWSGSAAIDANNTGGFGTNAMICMFTYAGSPFKQGIAYSTNNGQTFTKYPAPVIGNYGAGNRDPRLFWYAPANEWRMALWITNNNFEIFGSANLTNWTLLSQLTFSGASECPDMYQMTLDGNSSTNLWVFSPANGRYEVGTFDGTTFTPQTGVLRYEYGADSYAGQTYNNEPNGRRVSITWMQGGTYPGMPFNQQMSIPKELKLLSTATGPQLYALPVSEVASLRRSTNHWSGQAFNPGTNLLTGLSGRLFDIEMQFAPSNATTVNLTLAGNNITYTTSSQQLSALGQTATVSPVNGQIKLRVLLDVNTLELFANDGVVAMTSCFVSSLANQSLSLTAQGGSAALTSLDVYGMGSAWFPSGGTMYWDKNGATAGAGGPAPNGNWTNAAWSTDVNGAVATANWIQNSLASFAAGTDATGSYTVSLTGTQQVAGLDFRSGSLTLSGGVLDFISDNTVINATNSTQVIQSAVWGLGNLVKNGSGLLVLSNQCSYTGATIINGGVVRLGGAGGSKNILPVATMLLVAEGTTLDLSGVSQQISWLADGLGASGSIVNSNNASASVLTLSPATGTASFSGQILGGGSLGAISLVMSGTGAQILSGSNTYTGGTIINGGTLIASNNAALGDNGGSLSVNSGGNLQLNNNLSVGAVSLAGGMINGPPGASAVPALTARGFTASGGMVFVPLAGTGGLTNNSGTLVLLNANSYSGATVVNGGTLQLGWMNSNILQSAQSYYKFDNSANLGLDSSGNGNTLATASGAPIYTNNGRFSGALYLNGSSMLTTSGFPMGVPTNNNPYSLAVWIKPDTGCSLTGGWVGWGNKANSQANNLRLAGSSAVQNYWWANDLNGTMASGSFFDGNYHAVISTWDGTNEVIYIDGVNVVQRTPTTQPAVGATNFIVGKTINDANFKGWIDELLIANRAFTPAEIAYLYQVNPSANNSNFLPTNTAVRLAAGATINLNYSGTNWVGGIYTNGVALPGGLYSVGNLSGFITGAGSLGTTVGSLLSVSGNNQGGATNNPLAAPFVVRVTDASGNPVSGVSVSYAIAAAPPGATGQSLSVTSTLTDANGLAATTLTMGSLAGSYSVTAISAGLTGSPLTFSAFVASGWVWTGAVTGNWDTNTLNWINGAGVTTYSNGVAVQFDDTASGSSLVTNTIIVSPGNILVTNNTKNYTLNGSSLAGSGSLLKSGTGTLRLNAANSSYTGNVTVNSGTLKTGNDAAAKLTGVLGSGGTAGRQITVATGATLAFGNHDTFGNW